MQINFIYDSSVQNAPAGFIPGLIAAANIIDQAILNPITVNIDIGYGEDNGAALPGGTLGEAQPAFGLLQSYGQLVGELSKAGTSANDLSVLSNLPTTDPSNGAGFFVSVAQGIAWGVWPASTTQTDGYAGFSSTLPFDYDPSNGIAAGTYDFVGVAMHELTHALGRYIDGAYLTPENLLTYSSPGTLDAAPNSPRYFSIDGGKTNLDKFDTLSDPADFSPNGPLDAFNAALPGGTVLSWSSLDSEIMDVLGYQTASPAPATPNFAIMDTTTNTALPGQNGDVYTGPVAGINFQFLSPTTDSVNITANVSSVFIHSGPGNDALNVANVAGRNVLDGGPGSNFLVGSLNPAAQDTFYVDDRSATTDIWSTVVNAHAGDDATVWGLTPADFTLSWANNQGAAGYQGLTLHATAAGKPAASVTFAGFTTADLSNGRLAVSFGTIEGNDYFNITVRA
jgi:hypothetical protein